MPVKKISIALEGKTAKAALASATKRGLSLSAWLNEAAENALVIEVGLAAVAEWEKEHGALTEEELAGADRVLDGARRRPAIRKVS